MAQRILLLEDDPNLGLILQEHLSMNGFQVDLCVDGEEGIRLFGKTRYDLCLVDVMMPKKDGFTFVGEVRKANREIPLIFLTARSLKEDRIRGFKAGCDDYITKPFSVEELLLRIQAVLRRSGGAAEEALPETFEIGQYTFDWRTQVLSKDSDKRKLTAREADLLRLLCLNLNQTLDRDQALREIWGSDSYFNSRSMDVFISKLRKYFSEDNSIEIMSIRGKGFRLTVGR